LDSDVSDLHRIHQKSVAVGRSGRTVRKRRVARVAVQPAQRDPEHRLSDSPLGVQVWSNLALGVLCFLLAWSVFELFAMSNTKPRSRAACSRGAHRSCAGSGRTRWQHALAWKDFYFLTRQRVDGDQVFALRAAAGAHGRDAIALELLAVGEREGFRLFHLVVSIVIACAELAFIAASVFRQERQWKTLSSLAVLPMNMRQLRIKKSSAACPRWSRALLHRARSCLHERRFRELYPKHWTLDAVTGVGTRRRNTSFFSMSSLCSRSTCGGVRCPADRDSLCLEHARRNHDGHRRGGAMTLFLTVVCLGLAFAAHRHIGRRLEALAEEE